MEYELYKGFWTRPGTLDGYVVNEISSYKPLLKWLKDHKPFPTVLDIGANIGTFSRTASPFANVIAIEPDPENFILLEMNTSIHVIKLQGAVVHRQREVKLYQNRGKNKGLHSTVPTRGRSVVDVEPLVFHTLLQQYRPDALKIDCEGAEYEFLTPVLPGVSAVMLEYNLSRRDEQTVAQDLHAQFLEHDWRCIRQPRFGTKAWATLACYVR